MCSLMEKDALIEKVAETMALIARHRQADEQPNEDSISIGALTRKIYSSQPEELDFSAIVKQCDTVQAKYQVAV